MRKRRRYFVGFCALVLAAGAGVGIKYGRHYVWPKRFAVVVPGELFRSGRLEEGPLERVIAEHKLKTAVILLTDQTDDPRQEMEEATLRREGVAWVRIPMPGDGRADFADLERAADLIADEARRPMLVHCAAGVHRTGAAIAVWRMKYEGWTLDRAVAEMVAHGYQADREPGLHEHLRAWAEARRSEAADQP